MKDKVGLILVLFKILVTVLNILRRCDVNTVCFRVINKHFLTEFQCQIHSGHCTTIVVLICFISRLQYIYCHKISVETS